MVLSVYRMTSRSTSNRKKYTWWYHLQYHYELWRKAQSLIFMFSYIYSDLSCLEFLPEFLSEFILFVNVCCCFVCKGHKLMKGTC